MKCSCVVLFYENQSSGFGPDWNPAADRFWPAGLMFETPEQHSSISVLFLRFCRSSHTNRLWQKTHSSSSSLLDCNIPLSIKDKQQDHRFDWQLGVSLQRRREKSRYAHWKFPKISISLVFFFPFLSSLSPPFLSLAVTKVSSGCNTSRASPLMNRSAFVLFSRVLTVTASWGRGRRVMNRLESSPLRLWVVTQWTTNSVLETGSRRWCFQEHRTAPRLFSMPVCFSCGQHLRSSTSAAHEWGKKKTWWWCSPLHLFFFFLMPNLLRDSVLERIIIRLWVCF